MRHRTWILDASPLIVTHKAGFGHLLARAGFRIIIPREVAEEVLGGPLGDPAREWLSAPEISAWICPAARLDDRVTNLNLGRGETAVLSLAIGLENSEAIIDDSVARTAARHLGISLRGTLGVLIVLQRQGLIASLPSAIDAIRAAGLYLDEATVRRALELAKSE